MKPILKFIAFVWLTGVLFYMSCKKEYSCEGCTEKNKPPIANAGLDQVITLQTDGVSVDGKGSSDPDWKINAWLWTKISGPVSFNIANATSALTVTKNLVTERFWIRTVQNLSYTHKSVLFEGIINVTFINIKFYTIAKGLVENFLATLNFLDFVVGKSRLRLFFRCLPWSVCIWSKKENFN